MGKPPLLGLDGGTSPSSGDSSYAAGGMPLAFTQEDFLASLLCIHVVEVSFQRYIHFTLCIGQGHTSLQLGSQNLPKKTLDQTPLLLTKTSSMV